MPDAYLATRILDSFFRHSSCAVANGSEQKLAKTVFSSVFRLSLASSSTRLCFVIAVVFILFILVRVV